MLCNGMFKSRASELPGWNELKRAISTSSALVSYTRPANHSECEQPQNIPYQEDMTPPSSLSMGWSMDGMSEFPG